MRPANGSRVLSQDHYVSELKPLKEECVTLLEANDKVDAETA